MGLKATIMKRKNKSIHQIAISVLVASRFGQSAAAVLTRSSNIPMFPQAPHRRDSCTPLELRHKCSVQPDQDLLTGDGAPGPLVGDELLQVRMIGCPRATLPSDSGKDVRVDRRRQREVPLRRGRVPPRSARGPTRRHANRRKIGKRQRCL